MILTDHKRSWEDYLIHHTAVATLDSTENITSPHELAYRASLEAGYNPVGYGISRETATKIEDGKYLVNWTTGANCD